jgi:glycosyltransferase involved in cell wall biosynthesis
MRLLIVTTVPSTITAFLLPFAERFRAQGWRVDAAAVGISTNARCADAFDRLWDVQWSRNPLDVHNLLGAAQGIAKLVEREGYDLVHVHTPVAAFVTRFALRRMPKEHRPVVVYTAHGFHFHKGGRLLKNAAFLKLEKTAGRWTDYLVVINHEDETAAKRFNIVPPDRVVYMPGIGVDTARYTPQAVKEDDLNRVREELHLAGDHRLLLMVAEFIPRKRHRDALAAFARLGTAKTILAFAGEGPLMGQMKRLSHELGVSDRVRFLGFRGDIATLVRASTATMLTSAQEGLARSVMESLCLEVPVIGTDVRGIRELLQCGAGYLVKVGDIGGISQAIQRVEDDPEEARSMGRLGRVQMAAYDIRHIIKLHENLYSTALGETTTSIVRAA